jgi:hypothetical protein
VIFCLYFFVCDLSTQPRAIFCVSGDLGTFVVRIEGKDLVHFHPYLTKGDFPVPSEAMV